MNWLMIEILTGLQKLLPLRLDRSPADDTITGTAAAWMEALADPNRWNRERDTPRIRAAFRSLMRTCREWPAPAHLIEHLPPITITAPDRSRMLTNDASCANGAKHIANLIERLRLKTHQEAQSSERPEPCVNSDSNRGAAA